ncbi:MAG: tRNA lysidine(34) synthetase TilS [Bacilli bacterium]|nr:tRNA lysidine(34) synthetase TilS [Bacilli bacterium]
MNLSNLDKNKTYLLACSFGPDSMAAFHILLTHNYKFDVAIVNYHLRPESDSEVKGLEEYAKKHDIRVHVLDVKEEIKTNIEKRCRDIRYRYFKTLIDEYGYEALITAHQEDDLIETYLLQKKRKILTKVYGISEIARIFGIKVIRPFLDLSKKEMQEICDQNGVPYAIDSSNLEDKYLRNSIRHNIVEKMSKIDRKEILQEIKAENVKVKDIFDHIEWEKAHDIKYVLSLDEITYYYLINELVFSLKNDYKISYNHGQEILKVLRSDRPNVVAKIYKDLYLEKQYDSFDFRVGKISDASYSYKIDIPTVLDTEYFYLDFTGDTSNRNVSHDDYPLTIRNAQKGDKYLIQGYEVEVRRLFIDWKMPSTYRLIWPVIINKDNRIIYIPRYQKDFKTNKETNFYVKTK